MSTNTRSMPREIWYLFYRRYRIAKKKTYETIKRDLYSGESRFIPKEYLQ